MGPTDPPIQWAPAFLPARSRITNLNSRLHLVASSRMSGAIPPLPYTHLWRRQGKLRQFSKGEIKIK